MGSPAARRASDPACGSADLAARGGLPVRRGGRTKGVAMGDIERYRRHLPHWRMDGATYFVSWHLHRGQVELAPAERDLVLRSLVYYNDKHFLLFAAVVLDDHVHMLLQPLAGHALEQIMHSRKGSTSRQLVREHGRTAPVWQGEYFDRIIRNEADFPEKYRYIVENPLRRWPEIREYRWLWVRSEPVPQES